MAVAYETSLAPQSVTFDAAGETETLAFDAGSGANRVLLVYVLWRDRANDITGITYPTISSGGTPVAMTSSGAKVSDPGGILAGRMFQMANPASGSNNLAVTMGASSGSTSTALIAARVGNGADTTGTPFDGYTTANGTDVVAAQVTSLTVSSQTDDRVVVFHGLSNINATRTSTPTNYTERQDAGDAGGFSIALGDAAGATSVATSSTWTNDAATTRWVVMGLNVNTSAAGAATPNAGTLTMTGRGTNLGFSINMPDEA